jgi:methionyl aminopeptidase
MLALKKKKNICVMIVIKNNHEYELMKKAGSILAKTMKHIESLILPEATLDIIDHEAYLFLKDHQATPSFLGLYGYPYTLCASINSEVIHGFPLSTKKLREGDIVSIDIGCSFSGYHADMAYTFPVGNISNERKNLLQVTKQCLANAISVATCGNSIGDIGFIVQKTAEDKGYSVVRDYTGHGIGMSVHEEPQVPNFGKKGTGLALRHGMAIAIEPMINDGDFHVEVLSDKWTVVTKDGKDSAHFEHTVFIKESGTEVLTKLNQEGSA